MPSSRPALLLVAALLVPILATTRSAHAGGPPGMSEPTLPEAPTPHRTQHYGYQTFLADAAWVVGTAALSHTEGGGEALVALGYYGGAPLIHLLHHNQKAAAKSVGLRVLLPVAGAVAGIVVGSKNTGDDGGGAMAGALLGFAAGAATAMVIDWTVLSKVTIDVPHVATVSALRPGMKIGKHAATVSIAGSF